MLLSVLACGAAFICLVIILRFYSVSLGLPAAYLGSLLLIHVPGAVAHLLDSGGTLPGREFTAIGILFTAIGSVAFCIGVWLVHLKAKLPVARVTSRGFFSRFCLLGGWIVTTTAFLFRMPSVGAVLQRGGAVWMLGIMLALRSAVRAQDHVKAWRWTVALAVYPVLMLLLGGFLSYGIASVIIVLSTFLVVSPHRWRLAVGTTLLSIVGISVFVAYFEHRSEIRGAVWGGADVDTRIEVSLGAAKDVSMFDPRNPAHLRALDLRLNQNYFVGLAAARIASGKVDYLHGRSLSDGVLALVPRALWPEKPVVAGSPKVVAEMTGLSLSPTTSFGVGNVMEFQINYGLPGLIIGFLLLGIALGKLDRMAAAAEIVGDLGNTFFYFLPAVALIQPNGSFVEMASGAAAALGAAFGWRWIWRRWPKADSHVHPAMASHPLAQSF
jgi:hypothetical protein